MTYKKAKLAVKRRQAPKTATESIGKHNYEPSYPTTPQYATQAIDPRIQEAEMSIGDAMAGRTNTMMRDRSPNQIDLLTDQVEALKAKVLELELELLAFYRRTYGTKSGY